MSGEEIEKELKVAEAALEKVVSSLTNNIEPVHCVAQGRLDVALYAVKEAIAMDLQGDGT